MYIQPHSEKIYYWPAKIYFWSYSVDWIDTSQVRNLLGPNLEFGLFSFGLGLRYPTHTQLLLPHPFQELLRKPFVSLIVLLTLTKNISGKLRKKIAHYTAALTFSFNLFFQRQTWNTTGYQESFRDSQPAILSFLCCS